MYHDYVGIPQLPPPDAKLPPPTSRAATRRGFTSVLFFTLVEDSYTQAAACIFDLLSTIYIQIIHLKEYRSVEQETV